jgi:DNA-binding transcriptional regulator YhcF (GntR family)
LAGKAPGLADGFPALASEASGLANGTAGPSIWAPRLPAGSQTGLPGGSQIGEVRRPAGGAQGRRQAGERLRRAILAGDTVPGQRLVEEELAAMTGVTRASVRAALIDLTAEGPVERIPNRGARVRAITAAMTSRQPAETEQATRRHLRSVIAVPGEPGAAIYRDEARRAGPAP